MTCQISEMTIQDYDEAYTLWQRCEGIGLSEADSRCGIEAFLKHNPGLSFTARTDEGVAGTVLCGSDGRRGYLYHLAVDPSCRRMGIGQALMERSLSALRARASSAAISWSLRITKTGWYSGRPKVGN
jgi:ribosomal protein S18 acetylase RimI-like enzyme